MAYYRILEVLCEPANADDVSELLANYRHTVEWWRSEGDERRCCHKMIVDRCHMQDSVDELGKSIYRLPGGRLIIYDIEALYPEPPGVDLEEHLSFFGGLTREELYEKVSGNANLNLNFLALTVLSTVVAAIGLHIGDLAVVIGAMVIAPMLQPHIAFSLGASLGDVKLMRKAALVNITGLVMVIAISALIGVYWPNGKEWNDVILARTQIDYSNIALALAAGAAAVLSLTTGVSSALVGVMVAVALLPPLATCGLMLGVGELNHAADAFWLAITNIICINIASKLVFLLKGIRARSPQGKKASYQALLLSNGLWVALLAAVIYIITTKTVGVGG